MKDKIFFLLPNVSGNLNTMFSTYLQKPWNAGTYVSAIDRLSYRFLKSLQFL